GSECVIDTRRCSRHNSISRTSLRLRSPKIRSHYPEPTAVLKSYSPWSYTNRIPGHF
ncbi:Polyribonucleotide nucleotidyltransferase, partial [Clarias magur]